jgi:hypothetical protein
MSPLDDFRAKLNLPPQIVRRGRNSRLHTAWEQKGYEVIWYLQKRPQVSTADLLVERKNFRWFGRGNRSKNRNSASDLMSAEWEGGDIANEERILIKGSNKPAEKTCRRQLPAIMAILRHYLFRVSNGQPLIRSNKGPKISQSL